MRPYDYNKKYGEDFYEALFKVRDLYVLNHAVSISLFCFSGVIYLYNIFDVIIDVRSKFIIGSKISGKGFDFNISRKF